MKRTILLAGLLATAGVAQAGLSFQELATGSRTEIFNGIAGIANMATGTQVSLGQLLTDQLGTIAFTYLGNESGYNDKLLTVGGSTILTEANSVGTTVSRAVNSIGAINFKFEGNTGLYAINGLMSGWASGTSIGLIGKNMNVSGKSFDYVLGYNDSAGAARLGDWDDFVIGVKFTPVSAVPEPETYAMMLAGLGLMGSIVRRRNKSKS
jgi:hypothetical protein